MEICRQSEIINNGENSLFNIPVNEIYNWSINSNMHLNQEKCKEIQIRFGNSELNEAPLLITEEHQLKLVTEFTLL